MIFKVIGAERPTVIFGGQGVVYILNYKRNT